MNLPKDKTVELKIGKKVVIKYFMNVKLFVRTYIHSSLGRGEFIVVGLVGEGWTIIQYQLGVQ